jgi:hypothetical protein
MFSYEVLTGKLAFSGGLQPCEVMKIVLENSGPAFPCDLLPEAAQLIRDCWRRNPSKRPSFAELFEPLEKLEFQIRSGVRRERVRQFVCAVRTQ